MQTQLMQMRTTWGNLPRRAQLAIAGIGIVTLVVLYLVLRAATSTEWKVVTSDLSADKVGQAQTTLEEAGIENRMTPVGTGLEVPADMSAKASAALMGAGIAAKGGRMDCQKQFGEGSSMMSGTSQETAVKLETCQESQAANDIDNIEGVSKSSVDVTLKEKSLFLEEEAPAKASVVLDLDGGTLEKAAIRGIQQTVASRFSGLKPTSVSVTDETGALISADAESEAGNAQTKKIEIEAKYNAEVERKLLTQVEKIVGPGNAQVISNASLDLDTIRRQVQENSPSGENGEVLVELEDYEKELLDGVGEAGVQGPAGTATNVGTDPDDRTVTPDLATGADDEGDYAKTKGKNTYALNKVAEDIIVAPGTTLANRIAVIVDNDVDAGSAQAVKNALQAWMGGNSQDSFSFDQAALASAKPVSVKADSSATAIAGYLKWALLGLGMIGLAFVLRRSLTQRTAELLSPADDLLMLDSGDFSPIPIAELEAALAASAPDSDRKQRQDLQKKVEQIAEAKPHDVANELRRWMSNEDSAYAPSRRG